MPNFSQYEWIDLDPVPLGDPVGIAEEVNLRGREVRDALRGIIGTIINGVIRDAGGAVFNVKHPRFGALGDATVDDAPAIQATIDAASAVGGGVVWIPRGSYRLDTGLTVPASVNNNIAIVGEEQRNVLLIANAAIATVLRWGSETRDASGTFANITQYGRLQGFTITANAAAHSANLLDIVEADRLVIEDVLLQEARTGTGVRLLGSITSGGLNAPAEPSVRRCNFRGLRIANCKSPLFIDNADENDFYGLECDMLAGIVSGDNTLFGIEIKQGWNNRFFGTLVTGDTDVTFRDAYIGVKIDDPVQGNVTQNQFYGIVAEGFNRGLWIESNSVLGSVFTGYHSSINATPFVNGTGASPQNKTLIFSPIGEVHYYAGRHVTGNLHVIIYSASMDIPSENSNHFSITATNGTAFTINAPSGPTEEQDITIDIANTSGGALGTITWNAVFKLSGSFTSPATANRRSITFRYDGTNWREIYRTAGDQAN